MTNHTNFEGHDLAIKTIAVALHISLISLDSYLKKRTSCQHIRDRDAVFYSSNSILIPNLRISAHILFSHTIATI